MQFVDTKEVSSPSPRELKFVCYTFMLEDLANQLNDELMWCLMVFQHDCMASTSSVSKEKVVYVRLHLLLRL